MNRSGEGSGSDPQKSEAPVPSSEGQKPPVGEGPKPSIEWFAIGNIAAAYLMLLVSPNRFLVSVNQRHQEREEPWLSVRPVSSFMQFPRPSITRASSQHAHSERKKRSSWILFLNKNVYKEIDTYSFGQSLHGVFTPLY